MKDGTVPHVVPFDITLQGEPRGWDIVGNSCGPYYIFFVDK